MSMAFERPVMQGRTAVWILAAILAVAILTYVLPPASFYIDTSWVVGP